MLTFSKTLVSSAQIDVTPNYRPSSCNSSFRQLVPALVHTQPLGMLSSEIHLVYTMVGYTNNAIDVGCTTIGNKGFTALIAG